MAAPAIPNARGSAAVRRAEIGDGARTLIALVAVLAIVGVVLALTQSSPAPTPRAADNPHGLIAGATLQQARCSNWVRATAAEKAFAVRSLAGIAGAPTEYKGVRGTALTQGEAFNLLDGACAHSIARNFLLYELYNRAAGFRSLALQQP